MFITLAKKEKSHMVWCLPGSVHPFYFLIAMLGDKSPPGFGIDATLSPHIKQNDKQGFCWNF